MAGASARRSNTKLRNWPGLPTNAYINRLVKIRQHGRHLQPTRHRSAPSKPRSHPRLRFQRRRHLLPTEGRATQRRRTRPLSCPPMTLPPTTHRVATSRHTVRRHPHQLSTLPTPHSPMQAPKQLESYLIPDLQTRMRRSRHTTKPEIRT